MASTNQPQGRSRASSEVSRLRHRPKYVYEPLRSSKHVRVLTVLNYDPKTYQVHARINQVTLDEFAGRYTALSYTWGSPVEDFTHLREPEPPRLKDSPHDIELNIVPQDAFETFRRTDDFYAGTGPMLDLYTTNVGVISVQHNLSDWFKAYLDGWPHKQAAKLSNEASWFEITVFWIDAICIDQENKDEKAQQIPMMGEVYSSAARVLGWLGPNKTDLWVMDWWHRAVFGRLQKFLEPDRKTGIQQLREASFLDQSFWKEKFDLELVGGATWPACWVAYWAFYRTRKWFHRAWIVQEVILSTGLDLQCADVDLQFEDMAQFAKIIGEAGWLDALDRLAGDWLPDKFLDKRTRGYGITDVYGLKREKEDWHIRQHGWVEAWWATIFAIRRRDCLLPEDKIYASLGVLGKLLGGSDRVPFEVSATATAEEVYLEAAKTVMVKMTGALPLALLSFVEPDYCRNLKKLPSWLPDLTTSRHPEPIGGFGTMFSASGGCRSLSQDESLCAITDSGELHLRGFRLDTIKTTSVYHGPMREGLCVAVLAMIASLPEEYVHNLELDGQDRVAAVCHTLTCHETASYLRGSSDETVRLFKDFRLWLLDGLGTIWAYDGLAAGEPCPAKRGILDPAQARKQATELLAQIGNHSLLPGISEVETRAEEIRVSWRSGTGAVVDRQSSFRDQIKRTVLHRCLFTSRSGWLGLCSQSCEEGDEVWILERGAVPYVLRPRNEVGQEGTYKFMEECYVHGAMYGEVVTDERLKRLRTVRIL